MVGQTSPSRGYRADPIFLLGIDLPREAENCDHRIVGTRSPVPRFGVRSLAVVCVYSSTEYPPFSESLRGTVDSAPNGDPTVLLGDFNAHVGNNSDNWRGRIWWNDLPNLNPIVVFLLDFCASHTLFITNTMFTHKGSISAYGTRKLMIEFVFISSVSWPYVWDTWVNMV